MNILRDYLKTIQLVSAVAAMSATAHANTFTFADDPFAGSDALTTPGRQIVGGEAFINFDIATDRFSFSSSAFGINAINFAHDVVENLPSTGVNMVVLQTFDNDGDAGTPFLAGNAANIIAEQLTDPGAGFFIYFNSNLDLPRLVYSTDLSDNQADLKVLARLLNLNGEAGRDAFPTFTAANFEIAPVPEAANSLALLMISSGVLLAGKHRFVRRGVARS